MPRFKAQLLLWAQQFESVVWLDSNTHNDKYSTYEAILAVDAHTSITSNGNNAFKTLQDYQSNTNDWLFGFLTYDLKNDIEALYSNNYDALAFPSMYFFQPKKLIVIQNHSVQLLYLNDVAHSIADDIDAINACSQQNNLDTKQNIKIKLRIHKDAYFEKVNTLLAHIHRGNIYEANFCQEFYAEATKINPLETFHKLNAISQPPFAAFVKVNQHYVLSASPERYLKKENNYVISQPIKGTAKRSKILKKDHELALALQHDEKERSENIMIVDLVRNDLSHTATRGSVKVEELCKVYSFLQVHQMISTVSSRVDKNISPVELLRTTFPMGSMTGAPKISAMTIIEHLEETKRGLYSGSVGYFTPKGDFDFNVIIRSILYNAEKQYVSYSVGSAITAKSNPTKEYEECLLKAKAMREVLES